MKNMNWSINSDEVFQASRSNLKGQTLLIIGYPRSHLFAELNSTWGQTTVN